MTARAAGRRIAVIGSGIAGLGAAYLLSRRHTVTLFEKDGRLGGHTHTHQLVRPHGPVTLDTGFLVHNARTYPHLLRLFAELGVTTRDSDMSFGVSWPDTDYEYSTRDLSGFFAQRHRMLDPRQYGLFLEIVRFGRVATRLLDQPGAEQEMLAAFLDRHRFGRFFRERFLFPMAASIWSASLETITAFPAVTLIRFFHNHGMLNVLDHPTWKVVNGGSSAYIPPMVDAIQSRGGRIAVARGPEAVTRTAEGHRLTFADSTHETFDEVVLACHGDQARVLVADPTPAEREVLGAFTTTANDTWLHTDTTFLPANPRARASWNYLIGPASSGATLTYDVSRLLGLDGPETYCVTLNPHRPIEASQVLARMSYTHPLYTRDAIAAQARWAEISGPVGRHYCGAYWFYGFHEDGLRSAVRVAEALDAAW